LRGRPDIDTLIINTLLTLMVIVVLALVVERNLFAVVVLAGIYSFLMATVMVSLDAVDVAMTEAAVGAGISMVLLLSALYLVGSEEARPARRRTFAPLLLSLIVVGALVYGTLDLPAFSDAEAPIHSYVAPRYIYAATHETGVPNIVSAVLASYRGYDTLGETTVVFTAGIGVIALLRRLRRRNKGGKE
jgi:multicomponent Na+:H+ antiporter subunit B